MTKKISLATKTYRKISGTPRHFLNYAAKNICIAYL